jgi:phosphoribosylformylglycinamidine synthase subunit PurQ / glutaminase
MRCGVVVFPGSNCDHDVYHVLKHLLQQDVFFLWHGDRSVRDCELVVLPGGFSYGDYLRAGAMAALSPIMTAVKRHADAGGLVLGICNGFQMLCEAGLLPGALRKNAGLRFQCREVFVKVLRTDLPYTSNYREGQVLSLPIAHSSGNYIDSEARLDQLEAERLVVFRYCDALGNVIPEANPNGSARAIAGICNGRGNVLGLMPHPERHAEEILGNTDGRALFEAAVASLQAASFQPASVQGARR